MNELDYVKRVLRVTASIYDKEIEMLIKTARADLRACGVIETSEAAYLIKQAVVLYCKAYFGYQDSNITERYSAAYEHMKSGLVLQTQGAGK